MERRKERILRKLDGWLETFVGILVGIIMGEGTAIICKCLSLEIIFGILLVVFGFCFGAIANIRGDIERWD